MTKMNDSCVYVRCTCIKKDTATAGSKPQLIAVKEGFPSRGACTPGET